MDLMARADQGRAHALGFDLRATEDRWIRIANKNNSHGYGAAAPITRAGLPTATDPAGTGFVTTDPAPMVLPAPTSAMTIAPAPIQQSAPMETLSKR